MKNKQVSKETIVGWLKRIFSIQTLAVVAGIVAAIYAYKTYKDNQPAQISVVYIDDSNGTMTNLDNMQRFVQLLATNNRMVYFDWSSYYCPYPCIFNDTKKSIKDFKVELAVYSGELFLDESDVFPYYEMVTHSTVLKGYLFKYKSDVLNAKSYIPMPVIRMHLPDSIPISKDTCYNVTVKYEITYDGISRNRNFIMDYYMYFEDEDSWFVSDNHIDEFLTYCYQQGFFTEYKESSFVSVFEDENRVVNPPKRLTDKKFARYKKE